MKSRASVVKAASVLWLSLALGLGCDSSRPSGGTSETGGAGGANDAGGPGGSDGAADAVATLDPGTVVMLTIPPARAAALTATEAQVNDGAPTDAASFAQRWKPTYAPALGYDPSQALRLDAVQASHLKLNDGELTLLGTNGFVISTRQAFPSFFLGYKAIYTEAD